MLQNVHTDAISTFLNGASLELGTKADVDGGLGKRLDPTTTIFNVGDASKLTVPGGFEFVAPAGTEVWLAQETSPPSGADGYTQIWPGFSTESVPAGGVDGDKTTFTLSDVAMPADASVELWRGSFGGTTRMWSTDEGISSFAIGRTHMHANWAFTKPGVYTFTVTASATIGGVPVTSTAPYTFVVGPVASAAATTTALSAPSAIVVGEPALLAAEVTPAGATGWVEFLDGDVSLGHAPVVSGGATLTASALSLGAHSVTARFAPTVTNDFTGSASAPVPVAVTETPDSGVFGLKGVSASYASGSTLDVRVVNATLATGDTYRWIIRKAPETTTYVLGDIGDAATTGRLVRPIDSSYDGAEIMVQVRGINPATGKNVTKSATGYYPITVTGPDAGTGEPVALGAFEPQYRTGDNVTIAVQARDLTAGESFHLVTRNPRTSVEWVDSYFVPTGEQPWRVPADTLAYLQSAVQLRSADGTVLGQSPAFSPEIVRSEVQLSGLKSVYRAGDIATASVEVFPARNDVTYRWSLDVDGDYAEIEGQNGPTVEFDITADMDGARLYVDVINTELAHPWGSANAAIAVTDAVPGDQLLFFNSVAGHYHQGGTVALDLVADPELSEGDSVAWSWKLPGQDQFGPVPGATGLKHSLVAEQGLDGAQVRATLTVAGGAVIEAKPVTIHVDDHGAPARQKIAVEGRADAYTVGDRVQLTSTVAPASVLTRVEWLVQKAGDAAPSVVPGVNTADYAFAATAALDGAAVIARLTFDDGRVYVQSVPVLLTVNPAPEVPTTPEVPTSPEVPTTPEVPTSPEVPTTPEAPTTPEVPTSPEAPTTPEVPIAPTEPAAAPAGRTADSLAGMPTGDIVLAADQVRVGSVLTVSLGAAYANQQVAAWMFSTPVLLGGTWTRADANGRIAVTIPADAAPGTHRIAVFDAAGDIIGWQRVTVLDASGRLAETGASLAVAPVLAGGLLLLGGLGIVVAARLRTRRESEQG